MKIEKKVILLFLLLAVISSSSLPTSVIGEELVFLDERIQFTGAGMTVREYSYENMSRIQEMVSAPDFPSYTSLLWVNASSGIFDIVVLADANEAIKEKAADYNGSDPAIDILHIEEDRKYEFDLNSTSVNETSLEKLNQMDLSFRVLIYSRSNTSSFINIRITDNGYQIVFFANTPEDNANAPFAISLLTVIALPLIQKYRERRDPHQDIHN